MLNPTNCRAALALLGWTWDQLGEAADVSGITVGRFMSGRNVRADSRDKMQAAIEAAGVKLYNGNRPGARMMGRKP